VAGDAPGVDLQEERALQEAVLEMTGQRLLQSAHDCAEGGLAVCIAESAIVRNEPFGVEVRLDDKLPAASLFFGEGQGRIVVSCKKHHTSGVLAVAAKHGVPARVIGHVRGGLGARFVLHAVEATIDVAATDLAEVYRTAIPRLVDRALG
jgi:phosphoribosylformylglycinamidine synthase